MKNRILISDDSKKNSPIDEENIYSFMINDEPIALEVEILAKNNKIYKYGFELVKDNIISEWLYEKRVNKFYSIFEREDNNVTMKTNKIAGLSNIAIEVITYDNTKKLFQKILNETIKL